MKALELHQMANIKGGQDQTAEVLACTFDGLVMVGSTIALTLAPATGGLTLGIWALGWASTMVCYSLLD